MAQDTLCPHKGAPDRSKEMTRSYADTWALFPLKIPTVPHICSPHLPPAFVLMDLTQGS
jgi:hypothetical protein